MLGAVRSEARPVERDAFESRPSVGTVQITARAGEAMCRSSASRTLFALCNYCPASRRATISRPALNVRGGESDQNLILIDGYPIYNPFHLGGLFSTFIDPTVRDVTLMTGGFPARYGG